MHPIAVSTALFDGYSTAQALDEIAACGIHWVEPAFIAGYVTFSEEDFKEQSARKFGRGLQTRDLKINAVSAHMDLGGPEAIARLVRRIRFARTAGARIVITNAGKRSARDAIFCALEAAIPVCEDLDVTIAIENPGHGTGDLFERACDGVMIVRQFASNHLRLNYDFGNIFTYNDEPVPAADDFVEAAPYAVHAHLKDVASKDGSWQFVSLGEGSIDYRAIAATLNKHSSGLPLSLELPLRLSRHGKSDPRRDRGPIPLAEIHDAILRSLVYWQQLQEAF